MGPLGYGDKPGKGATTKMAQSTGSKQIKVDHLRMGQPSDIGKAPPERIYTRDYSKAAPAPDQTDLVSPALGNPLGR